MDNKKELLKEKLIDIVNELQAITDDYFAAVINSEEYKKKCEEEKENS